MDKEGVPFRSRGEKTLETFLGSEDLTDEYDKIGLSDRVRQAMSYLTPRQERAIRVYHFNDGVLDDVGAELGVTRERARQILVGAERALKKRLTRPEGLPPRVIAGRLRDVAARTKEQDERQAAIKLKRREAQAGATAAQAEREKFWRDAENERLAEREKFWREVEARTVAAKSERQRQELVDLLTHEELIGQRALEAALANPQRHAEWGHGVKILIVNAVKVRWNDFPADGQKFLKWGEVWTVSMQLASTLVDQDYAVQV